MGLTGDWDQRITRRTLLKTGGSLAAGITLAGIASGPAFGQAGYADNPFTLGVASGDPRPTGVVLWTRLAPDPLAVGGGMPAEPFEVRYEVSRDEDFHAIVRKGSTVALPDEAHSVHEEIHGLGDGNRVPWHLDLLIVDTVKQPTSPTHTLATFVVESGRPGAQLADTPVA